MPWGDDARRFLARVMSWPASLNDAGLVNLHYMRPNKDPARRPWVNGKAFRDPNEMVSYVTWLLGNTNATDMYFCTSLQAQTALSKQGKPIALRNIQNVLSSKVIFLDVDVKAGKGYDTLPEAIKAVGEFCKHWSMPPPSALVGSGGGVHCYWISNRSLDKKEWQPLAEQLRAAGVHFGLKFDGQCTVDIVRILRIPETSNHKTNPPTLVKLLHLAPADYDFDTQIKPHLAVVSPLIAAAKTETVNKPAAERTSTRTPDLTLFPKRAVPAMYASAVGETSMGLEPEPLTLDFNKVFKGCGFLREALKTGGKDYDQPQWNLTTLASTWMPNGREIAHVMSRDHSTYTQVDTDELYDRKTRERNAKDMGWTSCSSIEQAGCKSCATCPLKGKITYPFELGKAEPVKPVTAASNAPTHQDIDPWPVPLPNGYAFDAAGIVCRVIEVKEKTADGVESITVLQQLFYRQRLFAPYIQHDPDAIRFVVEGGLIQEGQPERRMRSVYIERENLFNGNAVANILSKQGVSIQSDVGGAAVGKFLMTLLTDLENARVPARSNPFGWLDLRNKGDYNAFVYGGKTFYRDGKVGPGGYLDAKLSAQYLPVGKRDPWMVAADFVINTKIMENVVMLATAFGSPLMRFTNHSIGMYSVFGSSGVGKSFALQVAAAVWGHPKDQRVTQTDTENSLGNKLGVLANLPVYVDEMTEQKAQAGVLAIIMQDGQEKNRLLAMSGFDKLHARFAGKWSLFMASTSNASFVSHINLKHKDTDAGAYRVFEVHTTAPRVTDPVARSNADALAMELTSNYGVVGLEYARFLAMRSDTLKGEVFRRGVDFATKVNEQQGERFWSTFCSCILLGAEFARDCGWAKFDIPELEKFLIKAFLHMRHRVDEQGQDSEDATIELMTDFFRDHFHQLMITDDYPWGHQARPIAVLKAPAMDKTKGVVTHFVNNASRSFVLISRPVLNRWLTDHEHSPAAVLGRIPHKIDKLTLGRNTPHTTGQERCFVIEIQPGSWLEGCMRNLSGSPDPQTKPDGVPNGKPGKAA